MHVIGVCIYLRFSKLSSPQPKHVAQLTTHNAIDSSFKFNKEYLAARTLKNLSTMNGG